MDHHAEGKWFIHGPKRRKENQLLSLKLPCWLSGVPDLFDRNKILSGGDLSHYQVPHCISFLLFCLICVYSSQFSILFWIMYLL